MWKVCLLYNLSILSDVYEILELDGLSIDSIKSLENLESLDFDEFSHGYGSLTLASPAKMSTLFRYCLRVRNSWMGVIYR